jgi:hypothetical protein
MGQTEHTLTCRAGAADTRPQPRPLTERSDGAALRAGCTAAAGAAAGRCSTGLCPGKRPGEASIRIKVAKGSAGAVLHESCDQCPDKSAAASQSLQSNQTGVH